MSRKLTDEQWLTQCIMEASCGHNDGYTMEWYADQVKKTKQKILNKRDGKLMVKSELNHTHFRGMKSMTIDGEKVYFPDK